jgi:predicted nucleic acid-binding protein
MVVIDTGPLVALFDDSEEQHEICYAAMKTLQTPPATTWPVLTEAFYLLGSWKKGRVELWNFILSGGLRIEHIPGERWSRMRELMEKYADLPMDLADASLVALSEVHKVKTIFTLDRTDFSVYRPKHTAHYKIIP